MKLGIGSFTFGWAIGVRGYEPPVPMDENGLLDAARSLGVRLVQIGDNLPLASFDEDRLSRLATRRDREGFTLEIGARGLTRPNLAAYIEIAWRLDAPLLRFVVDEESYRPTPEQVITILREALPKLSGGPTVALENHDRFSAATLQQIVESVGSESIGVCLDTANSYAAGEGWREVTDALAPYTVSLHVKDFTVERLPHQMGFTLTGKPAGEGLLDIPELLGKLAQTGRCHSAVLELWTPPQVFIEETLAKERAWANQSIQYLRTFFPDESDRTVVGEETFDLRE